MTRMPALFIGHGSPMNLILDNDYTKGLKALARRLPRPEAICVISAHWMTRGSTFISCQPSLRQIYDFYGFPDALYSIRYEPPGHPALAKRALELLSGASKACACNESWGNDHAAWSLLHHMFPEADIPLFLISIDMAAPLHRHLAFGKALAPLREEGVLFIGSGNIVHNLPQADFRNMEAAPDPRGVAFDEAVKEALLRQDVETLAHYDRLGEAARYSVPTPDHYLPLLYTAAMRQEDDELEFTCESFQNRSVSMRGLMLGAGD